MKQDVGKGPPESMSETELLQLVGREGGDRLAREAALEELLRRHYGWITRMCVFELRDEEAALDCAQVVMVEIAKSIHRFDGRSELKTWLFVIAKRCIYRARKKQQMLRRRQQSLEVMDGIPEAMKTTATADTELIRSEQQRLLLEILAELPERQRHALLLHYFEDLSVEESAKRLGCSVASVKTHLHRGRKALGRRIAAREDQLLANE